MDLKDPEYWTTVVAIETVGEGQFVAFPSRLSFLSRMLCEDNLSRVISITFPGCLPGNLAQMSALEPAPGR